MRPSSPRTGNCRSTGFRAILDHWPARARRARAGSTSPRAATALLRATAERWATSPPDGFTIAAGITTAAPAVAALLARVARMPGGAVVLPALACRGRMPDAEWDALGPDEQGTRRGNPPAISSEAAARPDGRRARRSRGLAVGRARRVAGGARPRRRPRHDRRRLQRQMERAAAARAPPDRHPRRRTRRSGRARRRPSRIALREALETPGRTAALVTPDRMLAARVSALLERWGIEADDSAGRPLSQTPAGTLLLGIAAAVGRGSRPGRVARPAQASAGRRQATIGSPGSTPCARSTLRLRGPRPPAGLDGARCAFRREVCASRGPLVRPRIASLGADPRQADQPRPARRRAARSRDCARRRRRVARRRRAHGRRTARRARSRARCAGA